MPWKIGVDGGGSKTECILVDPAGGVAARHVGPGCSPSLAGRTQAAAAAAAALAALRAAHPAVAVGATLLCMAGSREFWREFGAGLAGFGAVATFDDSVPVLELGTGGRPGIVLHAGTGSFVAARGVDGATHYAGGTGWRFGDEGSGYDLGRRAIGRALLELQGWAPASGLGALVTARTGQTSAAAVSAHFYGDPATNQGVAALAPDVLALAAAGDPAAAAAVTASVSQLLALGLAVTARLFPEPKPADFRAAVSGHILNHPFAVSVLKDRSPWPLGTVTEAPIEGVRRLLVRTTA